MNEEELIGEIVERIGIDVTGNTSELEETRQVSVRKGRRWMGGTRTDGRGAVRWEGRRQMG